MGPLHDGFVDELVKLAAKEDKQLEKLYRQVRRKQGRAPSRGMSNLRGKGRKVSRDYLASMLLGAAATPALTILGGKISRGLHNRAIMSAIKKAKTPKQAKALRRELYSGKSIGRTMPGARAQDRPIATAADLAGDAGKGALYGSVLQMMRDRYAGSAGVS